MQYMQPAWISFGVLLTVSFGGRVLHLDFAKSPNSPNHMDPRHSIKYCFFLFREYRELGILARKSQAIERRKDFVEVAWTVP